MVSLLAANGPSHLQYVMWRSFFGLRMTKQGGTLYPLRSDSSQVCQDICKCGVWRCAGPRAALHVSEHSLSLEHIQCRAQLALPAWRLVQDEQQRRCKAEGCVAVSVHVARSDVNSPVVCDAVSFLSASISAQTSCVSYSASACLLYTSPSPRYRG